MLKLMPLIAAFTVSSTAIAQDTPPAPRGGKMPTPDQIFVFMDANKDGSIAKDEAKGPMAQHFDHIDADKNGKISPAELKTAMTAMRPPEGEPEAPAQ